MAASRTQRNRQITLAAAAAMAGLFPAVVVATLAILIPGAPFAWCWTFPQWESTHFDPEVVRTTHPGHGDRVLQDLCEASHLLRESDEPPLDVAAALPTYRLTMSPSFTELVIIRVEFGASAARLVVKLPDENALYTFRPAAPPRIYEAVLPLELASGLRSRLEEPTVWGRGLHHHAMGHDGTTYVLERIVGGIHEVRSHWSPSPNDPELRGFREAAEALVAIACESVYCPEKQ